jgi:c-di-GMP-binding flagellar brake protein YcgR
LNTIETLAEVAWIDIHLGEVWGDYRCGVKFIDISPEAMNKLKNFLRGFHNFPNGLTDSSTYQAL